MVNFHWVISKNIHNKQPPIHGLSDIAKYEKCLGAHRLNIKSVSPEIKLSTFLTQDYSHILHVYFVGVFCCYRNVTLS